MYTMTIVGYCLFALVLVCSLKQQAANEVAYTVTADDDPCTLPHRCLSLSQFAANPSGYHNSNTTLVFRPGTHYLTVTLTVSNVEHFSMHAETSDVQILCTNASFHFSHSRHIDVASIEFIGCASNHIEDIAEFVLQNTIFRSGMTMSGGVIHSVASNITIATSIFHSNVATWQGGVIRSRSSVITISACRFDNNTATGGGGGVLYLLYSSVKIRESDFNNSRTDFSGGVVYSQNSTIEMDTCKSYNNIGLYGGVVISLHSSVMIKSSKIHCNSATIQGGVLDSHSSNVTIQASEFDKNSAASGGVLYARGGSNVTIDASRFTSNTASISGGALYSSGSIVTIRECQFSSNVANLGMGLYSSGSTITIRATSQFDNITAAYREGVLYSSNSNISVEPRLNISDDDFVATKGGTVNSIGASSDRINSIISTIVTASMIGLQTTDHEADVTVYNDSFFISSTQSGVTTSETVATSVPLTTTKEEASK